MRLLYVIIKFICFPGTYLRGFWENLTCKVLHLEVESEGYMRPDEACGHVEHTLASTGWSAWLMAVGPGFMCFCTGSAFFLFGLFDIFYMGITFYDNAVLFILSIISMYLGGSLLCAAFPLTEDILNFWDVAYRGGLKGGNIPVKILKIIGIILSFPVALITRVGAFLEKNCVTFLLTVAILVFHIIFVR